MNDDQLWSAFETQSLAHAEWTHTTHVRTAFLFVRDLPVDEAHLRMRAGIIRLNERHGLVETSARGYFETLTRCWLVFVADARLRSSARTSLELLERCPELSDRHLPLRHYSRERLHSVRARAIFLEPDLSPLPEVP
ncbi:MAG TPA: hypothetical protein VHU80_09355 [Polyangiaceae bacterium]|jgi:hypothetical protein|nr:hypothetical protein [Polyangiaceae bacterium]